MRSENDDADTPAPICTRPVTARLTMTWLWPRLHSGPARYTNSLNSEPLESIGYSPGAGSDCRLAWARNCGVTGRGRRAAHAATLSTRTAMAILLNIYRRLSGLVD